MSASVCWLFLAAHLDDTGIVVHYYPFLGLSYVFLINDYRCLYTVRSLLVCIEFMVLCASVFVNSVVGPRPRDITKTTRR
jgi:hypothetical protein